VTRSPRARLAAATVAIVIVGLPLASLSSLSSARAATRHQHHPRKSLAPLRAAWFDESRPTPTTPPAPMSGVGPKDLVVAGLTIATSLLPLPLPSSPAIKQVTAFTTMSFRLPKNTSASTLTLNLTGTTTAKLDNKLPSGASPVACPLTATFKAGGEQAASVAPTYNCKKRSAVGQLRTDQKAIVFPGIGRLTQGRRLSFAILPGSLGAERLVFTKPGSGTLGLLSFAQPPASSPPRLPHVSQSTTPRSSRPPSSTGTGSGFGNGDSTGSGVVVPPVGEVSTPPLSGQAPQIAQAGTTAPRLTTTAAKPINDSRTRLSALALLVALVVMTAWLSLTDRRGGALTTLRIVRALRSGGAMPAIAKPEWGVGRFSSPRDGPPPAI
jgi:hypothetical protein